MSTCAIIAIVVLVIYCIFMSWSIYTAPMMPDDYGLNSAEQKIWDEFEKNKKQNEKNK